MFLWIDIKQVICKTRTIAHDTLDGNDCPDYNINTEKTTQCNVGENEERVTCAPVKLLDRTKIWYGRDGKVSKASVT